MRMPGATLVGNIERAANGIELPMTRGLGIADLLRQTSARAEEHHLRAFAAGLAYRALFATFAFAVFLLSLLSVLRADEFVNELLAQVSVAMPRSVFLFIRDQLLAITRDRAQPVYTVSGGVAVAAALWSGSNAFRDVVDAMNVMYRVRDARRPWKVRLISSGLSVAVFGLSVGAVVLVIFGRRIGGFIADAIGLETAFRWFWNVAQWPVLIAFILLAFALVYYYAPDVEQDFRFITPGSLMGVMMWLLFTGVFLLFVNGVGLYGEVYGALAGLVIHMLYTYYTSYILLLGAQMNQVIEEHAPEGKNPGEKRLPGESASAAGRGR